MLDFFGKLLERIRPLAWPLLLTGGFILVLGSAGYLGVAVRKWLEAYQGELVVLTVFSGMVVLVEVILAMNTRIRAAQRRRARRRLKQEIEAKQKTAEDERRQELVEHVEHYWNTLSENEFAVLAYLLMRKETTIIAPMGEQPFASLVSKGFLTVPGGVRDIIRTTHTVPREVWDELIHLFEDVTLEDPDGIESTVKSLRSKF